MTEATYNKVVNFINKHHMIDAGDLIAVGVSGGADSVCLLHLLRRLSGDIPCQLLAVHVDHGVREDSMQDAAYVERLCDEMRIPFYLKKADMHGYAKEHGLSPEEAGRQLRYAAFEQAAGKYRQENQTYKIAVAHNANDRAETMLFHVFRGSGIRGLRSIQPVRGHIIRPVLCLERDEIERYLAGQHLEYCQDSTNEEDEYTRNKIRHHILPYAEREICSGAVAHMGELADILTETENYLERQTKLLYQTYVEKIEAEKLPAAVSASGEGIRCLSVRCTQLLSEDPVMYKRVLLTCMEQLTPYRKDITGQHIADLVKLMTRQGSKELTLPYGIKAYKEYGTLILYRNTADITCQTGGGQSAGEMFRIGDGQSADKLYMVEPPMDILVSGEGTYTFSLLENNENFYEKKQNITENRYTKWFDYDKITTALLLRTRQQGDYLTIDKALHTKSVKQYMIDEKIPKIKRDSMHILADGDHVLWIPGHRISECYKVDEGTKRILQVQLRGGYHGGTN